VCQTLYFLYTWSSLILILTLRGIHTLQMRNLKSKEVK
jgi:hypothetical protein